MYEGLQDLSDHICMVFSHLVGHFKVMYSISYPALMISEGEESRIVAGSYAKSPQRNHIFPLLICYSVW